MPDKLTEVAKKLAQTKKNSDAAVRRYNAVHPRIERIRDIFDDTISFEMEFETTPQDAVMRMDLYFNKPPPLKNCCTGRYCLPCQQYTTGPGDQLLQVTARYQPGTVAVFRDGVALTLGAGFSEYDPVNGLVWIQGTSSPTQIFNVCYIRDNWVTCAPNVIAQGFYGNFFAFIGNNDPYYSLDPDIAISGDIQFLNSGVTSFISSVSQTGETGDSSQAVVLGLNHSTPEGAVFPLRNNTRVSWTASIAGTAANRTMELTGGSFGYNWRLTHSTAGSGPGFYLDDLFTGSGYEKISNILAGTFTIDNNFARGTTIFIGPGVYREQPTVDFSLTSHVYEIAHNLQVFGAVGAGEFESTATLSAFEIGCSMESASG